MVNGRPAAAVVLFSISACRRSCFWRLLLASRTPASIFFDLGGDGQLRVRQQPRIVDANPVQQLWLASTVRSCTSSPIFEFDQGLWAPIMIIFLRPVNVIF